MTHGNMGIQLVKLNEVVDRIFGAISREEKIPLKKKQQ